MGGKRRAAAAAAVPAGKAGAGSSGRRAGKAPPSKRAKLRAAALPTYTAEDPDAEFETDHRGKYDVGAGVQGVGGLLRVRASRQQSRSRRCARARAGLRANADTPSLACLPSS